MTIGEKIRQLRLQNSVTQEKLADYLNISYQAISKWENNNALPDISLVVPLANFFEISTDELFDRNTEAQAEEIEQYKKRDLEFANKGYIAERITLWREAVQKYPRDFYCLINLAHALWSTLHSGKKFENDCEQNAKEAVLICERILKDCTDNNIRESALQLLVYTYATPSLSFADETKAEQYAEMAGNFYTCTQTLLENAYYTHEGEKKALTVKHSNTLQFMDHICMNLYLCSDRTPEEQIFACETALKLWKTLIYDDNFLFYHCRISDIYYYVAAANANLLNKHETLENLKKALEHVGKYDNQPYGEQYYTAAFVCATCSDRSKTSKNYTETYTELIREYMKNTCFDFIRDDPEFMALQDN